MVLGGRRQLVLSPGVEVACVVTLEKLAGRLTPCAVDLAPPPNGRTQGNLVSPAQHMLVLMHAQELACFVKLALDQGAVPRPYRHVGDGISVARKVMVFCQMTVQYIKLALDFHRIAIDRVLE